MSFGEMTANMVKLECGGISILPEEHQINFRKLTVELIRCEYNKKYKNKDTVKKITRNLKTINNLLKDDVLKLFLEENKLLGKILMYIEKTDNILDV